MSDSKINLYANYISKQLVREGVAINENREDPDITKIVAKQAGISPKKAKSDLSHVHSDDDHHTYAVGKGGGDDEPLTYLIHHKGQTHSFTLPKENDSLAYGTVHANKVHEIMKKVTPNVSLANAKAVTRHHNGRVGRMIRSTGDNRPDYLSQRGRRFHFL